MTVTRHKKRALAAGGHESREAQQENTTLESDDEYPGTESQSLYIFDGVSYSTYQEMVNAKRKRNEAVLQGLGFLDNMKAGILATKKRKKATQRGTKRQKETEGNPTGGKRKSSRLSSEKTNLVALDYYVNDWKRDHSIVTVESAGTASPDAQDSIVEEPKYFKDRLNDGSDLTLRGSIEIMDKKWVAKGSVEATETFFRDEMTHLSQESVVLGAADEECDLSDSLASLSVDDEESVAKVTPERIYSVAVHPSESKLLACAGDKLGYIGLWDVDAKSGEKNDGVHLFRVHSRPVCALEWINGCSMVSSSYDGTVRSLDVESGKFQEIFATYDDSNSYYAEDPGYGIDTGYKFWHQYVCPDHRCTPCLFVATSTGSALHVDLRVPTSGKITFNAKLSEKKINTLSLHMNGSTLASAGNDGEINLWDVRKFSGSRNKTLPKPVATQSVGLSISSSYFSPSGESLLSTSFANRLDLTRGAHKMKGIFKPTNSIPHNNQTGRWLSTFMACWHPRRDVFVCGSMKRPRCVEIYDGSGELLRSVTGDSLTAVASRCCFHPSPSKLIVVGGNSSGRVVVIR